MRESRDGNLVEDDRGMTAAKEFRTDPRADIAKTQRRHWYYYAQAIARSTNAKTRILYIHLILVADGRIPRIIIDTLRLQTQ